MFLNEYLFFSNMIFIFFCFKYIRFLELYDKLDKINELREKAKKKKSKIKKSLNDQLNYIKINDQVDDYEFELFPWKVVIFMVAIFTALLINRIEPIVFFGTQIKYSLIIFVILLGWMFSVFTAKLGVKY